MQNISNICVPTNAEELIKALKHGAENNLKGFAECLTKIEEDENCTTYFDMLCTLSDYETYEDLHLLFVAIELGEILTNCTTETHPIRTQIFEK